ncbi:glycosyltransferase [Janthinobacterium sp. RB2P8]|uniref:glycosyltransferase n=1 Tax=Janthinobacterium sp. RB2P8 TaxID=3424191 RepID=UPI003F205CEF
MSMTVGLIVPTLNAGVSWGDWLRKVQSQTHRPNRILIIDSSSDDETAVLAKAMGCEVLIIPRKEFNHGTTRQLGASIFADMDILVYMTQDAMPAENCSFERLLIPFSDPDVAASYGRQLPNIDAGNIGAHSRLFNYPEISAVRSLSDAKSLGLKVAFMSNSFSAYRRVMLNSIGGFPDNNIFGEDTYVAAKLLSVKKNIAYCADALVYHSHDYTYAQDFRRCFDIGVFHSREPWMLQKFGRAEGEGKKFVISEVKFLLKKSPWLLPDALIRTLLKYAGYKLGLCEKNIPLKTKMRLSMHKEYWLK